MLTDLSERPTALYRFYDSACGPIYFGIAVNPENRWLAHEAAEWWTLIDPAKTTIDWYSDRASAFAAERDAIKAERPAFNRTHADYRPKQGISMVDARKNWAAVLDTAAAGETTYITSHGRRLAAVVPLAVADAAFA